MPSGAAAHVSRALLESCPPHRFALFCVLLPEYERHRVFPFCSARLERLCLSELAASLPTGTHARNEILKLLGKDILESAEPAFWAIFYDVPRKMDAPAFLRFAHVGIETLEKATELVGATEGVYAEQGAIYRAGNAVVVECRVVSGDMCARLRSEASNEQC